jgi:hypothetical protein
MDASASVTVHCAEVPVQAPLQPTKLEPGTATAVSVTASSTGKRALHSTSQSIPVGDDVTLPVPAPAMRTVSASSPSSTWANVTSTMMSASTTTSHVAPLPQALGLHATSDDPESGLASRCRVAPCVRFA